MGTALMGTALCCADHAGVELCRVMYTCRQSRGERAPVGEPTGGRVQAAAAGLQCCEVYFAAAHWRTWSLPLNHAVLCLARALTDMLPRCMLRAGFFGADCSLSMGGDGKVEVLAGQGYRLAPHRPRVYVYELPPHFNVW